MKEMEALGADIMAISFLMMLLWMAITGWANEGGWYGIKRISQLFSFASLLSVAIGVYLLV